MNQIINIYPQYLYIFQKNQLKNTDCEYLVVIKDEESIQEIDRCLVFHYQDDFESFLIHQLPSKMRKTKQLLSYQECFDLMMKLEYGTCSFMGKEYPYSFPINHIIYQDKLFFHTGMKGMKLEGYQKPVIFNLVEDLGINKIVGTHNHRSVHIYGYLDIVQDESLKREVLHELVDQLAPESPFIDEMVKRTNILEIKIDYVIGKKHIR